MEFISYGEFEDDTMNCLASGAAMNQEDAAIGIRHGRNSVAGKCRYFIKFESKWRMCDSLTEARNRARNGGEPTGRSVKKLSRNLVSVPTTAVLEDKGASADARAQAALQARLASNKLTEAMAQLQKDEASVVKGKVEVEKAKHSLARVPAVLAQQELFFATGAKNEIVSRYRVLQRQHFEQGEASASMIAKLQGETEDKEKEIVTLRAKSEMLRADNEALRADNEKLRAEKNIIDSQMTDLRSFTSRRVSFGSTELSSQDGISESGSLPRATLLVVQVTAGQPKEQVLQLDSIGEGGQAVSRCPTA